MKKKILSTVIGSVVAFSATSTTVYAAESTVIEEILVTASKRGAMALQDIPTSISAIDQETLGRMGAVAVEDLTRSIPALDTVDAGPGQKQYLVRGINAEGESTVAVLLDNIPQVGGGDSGRRAGTNTPDFDLYDMQQVEVLRGPQGTQYGANSVAGVVRYVTNKPSFDGTEFEVSSGASQFDGGEESWEVKSLVNSVLIEDKLAFRGSASYIDTGGYIDNIVLNEDNLNSSNRSNIRLALSWNISENTSLLGQYFYQEIDADGRTTHSPYDWQENVGPPFLYTVDGEFVGNSFETPAAGELKSNAPVHEPYEEKTHTFALTLESDLDWGNLTVATSHVERDQTLNLDSSTPQRLLQRFADTGNCIKSGNCVPGPPFGESDGKPTVPPIPPFMIYSADETIVSPTGLVVLNQDQTQKSFNFEARFATKLEGSVNYMGGVFYQQRDMILDPSKVYAVDPATGLPTANAEEILMLHRESTFTTTQQAIFGEVYFDITDDLELMVGGRYFDTEQELDEDIIVPFANNEDAGGTIGNYQDSDGETNSIYKVNLSWAAAEDVMVYANWSEGFRSSGVNQRVIPDIPLFYASDKTTNYEIGAKTTLLDGRLQANVAVYRIDWEDMQVGIDVTSQFGGLVNASGDVAEINGYEIELLYMPTDNITLGANYADIDAKLTVDLIDAVSQEARDAADDGIVNGKKGDSLLGSPEYSGSAFAMYDFELAGMSSFVRADVQFQSSVKNNNYSESRNTPSNSYELINLRLGIEQDEHWSYAFYVRNVTNEVADLTVYNNFQQNDRVTPSAPRTVGFTVNYRM